MKSFHTSQFVFKTWMRRVAFVLMAVVCLHTPAALAQEQTGTDAPDQIIPVVPPPDLLDETCVVSILNRTTQVRPDGTWNLPNVPANFGSVRARATCERDGISLFGQ